MQDPNAVILAFQDYANSLKSGYLKTWKASSIIMTIVDFKLNIIADEQRMFSYLENCLSMEGFSNADIMQVYVWLKEWFGNYNA